MSDKHIAHFDHHNKDDDKSDCLYFDAKDIIYSNLDIIIIIMASFYLLLNKNLEKHENEHAHHMYTIHELMYTILHVDSRSVSHREVSRAENLFLRQNV